MESFLTDLTVANDLAERCVKEVQEYKDATKDPEHRDEILLVATDHHPVFKDLSKKALQQTLDSVYLLFRTRLDCLRMSCLFYSKESFSIMMPI